MFSSQKLKSHRISRGLSQTDIAESLHISRAAYSAWETGKRKPNQKNLQALATLFHIDIEDFKEQHPFLTTYIQLTPTNQHKLKDYADELLDSQKNKIINLHPVTVLDSVALSAGIGEGIYDEFETREVFTDKQYVYDVATWITGDSMEPIYHDGEVALIRESGFDYDGAVYAVAWNDRVYIKKVYLKKNGLLLVSINKSYPDRFVSSEDRPRIVGKIVGNFQPIE